MRKTTWKKALALFTASMTLLSLTACGGAPAEEPPAGDPNIIVTNAAVYTADAAGTTADTVVIQDGLIAYVGDAAGAEEFKNENSQIIDAQGNTVMPSMVDSHMHPTMSALVYYFEISLSSVFTVEEYQQVIGDFIAAHPDLEVYTGNGFMRSLFDSVGPRKELLDEVCADKPIILTSADGHSTWVNSKALELAGITKDTPNPDGGIIQHDPETGEPAGLLQEAAGWLVADLKPEYTKEQYKEAILWLQDWLNARGVTTVFEAGVALENEDWYMAYEELAEAGELNIRVRSAWQVNPLNGETLEEMLERVDRCVETSKKFTTDYFQINTFKVSADAVLEEETAYMANGYLTHPDDGWKGSKTWEDEEVMAQVFTRMDEAGFQIHCHQIGDAAAEYVLDGFEKVQANNGERDSRHTLVHVQFLNDADKQRMADMKMNAVIAPYWMAMDNYYWGLTVPSIGKEMADSQYPAQSLFDAGINVAIHSDFFVSEPEWGNLLYSAVTRTFSPKWFDLWGVGEMGYERTPDPDAEMIPDVTFGPLPQVEERMTLEETVQAATYNGAYTNFMEDEIGSIEVGKKADLVVMDMNIFEEDIETVAYVEPVMTFFDGQIVFEK